MAEGNLSYFLREWLKIPEAKEKLEHWLAKYFISIFIIPPTSVNAD